MGQALYRKHRPKSLADVVGQEHITGTLKSALKQGTISHAYLLTGPRGTGKTSVARILAYEVNGLPYDEKATHLDIIEIDAASNRRIDEIRELKERVNIAPTSAKYKVYIIDEVHMLTKEAFNALLKTLEEPPEHAIFILATTEAHKVPETIISRTQRFTFKPVAMDKVIKHLSQIAKSENIAIDDAAIGLIAAHGEGSFRDSISLLDQVRHTSKQISLADIQQAIGQAPDKLLGGLIEAISAGDVQSIAASVAALRDHGSQAPQIARQLSALLRVDIVNQQKSLPLEQSIALMSDLLQVPATSDPAITLELALYKTTFDHMPAVRGPKTAAPYVPEPEASTPLTPQPEKAKPVAKKADRSQQGETEGIASLDEASWQEVLLVVKARHNTLYGVARMGAAEFTTGKITLSFGFAFHQKRISDNKNKRLLMDIINEVTGSPITLECVLDSSAEPFKASRIADLAPAKDASGDLNLEAISNIFGGAEIVE